MRLQHRVLGVAAPVSARHARQLERLRVELAGRGEVRAAAQVDPGVLAVARAVHGDRLALGQLHHPFGLERSRPASRRSARTSSRGPHFADQRLVGGDDAPHLLLDRRQILLGERAALGGRREVVIEAVVGRRAEGDLRAREQVLHRLGEDVREVVADQLERVRLVARGDQREAGIALERAHDVAHLAVDLAPRARPWRGPARSPRRRRPGSSPRAFPAPSRREARS